MDVLGMMQEAYDRTGLKDSFVLISWDGKGWTVGIDQASLTIPGPALSAGKLQRSLNQLVEQIATPPPSLIELSVDEEFEDVNSPPTDTLP